jgi:hypothetical protein
MDLERIKRQLTDKTKKKLDFSLKNQQLFDNESILYLFSKMRTSLIFVYLP